MKENKKPKFLLVLKIMATIFAITGITMIILATTVFAEVFMGNMKKPNFAFLVPGTFLVFISFGMLAFALLPEIAKLKTKTAKYITAENKEDFKDIINTGAECSKEAIATVAKAVKIGLEDTKFCKYCGSKIDNDSVFCKDCGKKQ